MMQIKSRVPDYLPQLTGLLLKSGAGEPAIARFHTYWNSLPPQRHDAPCPFCFDKGVDSPLVELNTGSGIDQLRCAACKRIFVLRSVPGDEAAAPVLTAQPTDSE